MGVDQVAIRFCLQECMGGPFSKKLLGKELVVANSSLPKHQILCQEALNRSGCVSGTEILISSQYGSLSMVKDEQLYICL